MDTLTIDNHPKALAFKTFKRLFYKYYPKFVIRFKKHPNKVDIKRFLILLYEKLLEH